MQELPYFFLSLNTQLSTSLNSQLSTTGEATSRTAALPRLEQHLQVRLEQLAPRALEL